MYLMKLYLKLYWLKLRVAEEKLWTEIYKAVIFTPVIFHAIFAWCMGMPFAEIADIMNEPL